MGRENLGGEKGGWSQCTKGDRRVQILTQANTNGTLRQHKRSGGESTGWMLRNKSQAGRNSFGGDEVCKSRVEETAGGEK